MKEISDIIGAYKTAKDSGKTCALATVVHVEGSSYRRPGARMLVTDDGMLTGAISGGCLEGDALRKALLAISEGKNKLVTYDTTDEDDAKFGVQLGCNGIVHILFEPINSTGNTHPIRLLQKVKEQRRPSVLVTLFSLASKTLQPGTCLFYADAETVFSDDQQLLLNEKLRKELHGQAAVVLQQQTSQVYSLNQGQLDGFIQFIPPSLSLIIAGAGNDAMPLVHIASMLGWEVTIVDGRQSHATVQRFPLAKNIIVAKAENVLQKIEIDNNTVCVLMTHNYNYDIALLKKLLPAGTAYIGILGPKTKMQRMYNDLENEGIAVLNKETIYSPVGLDIGAETSEEIALSIAAEIKAVIMKKEAKMLRYKEQPVHS